MLKYGVCAIVRVAQVVYELVNLDQTIASGYDNPIIFISHIVIYHFDI